MLNAEDDDRTVKEGSREMERVASIDDLRRGDEVLFCRQFARRRAGEAPFYDPHIPTMTDAAPLGMRYGIVLETTDRGGVLLWVTTLDDDRPPDLRWLRAEMADAKEHDPEGLLFRKHWRPAANVWARTGRTTIPPPPDDLEWADPDVEWQRAQKQKPRRRER